MSQFSGRWRLRVVCAALFCLTACTTWEPFRAAPGPTDLPSRVRLTLDTGERVTLRDPVLIGDTVLAGRALGEGPWTEVALERVRLMEAEAIAPGRTALAVVGVPVLALALVVVVVYAAGDLDLDLGR